MLAADPEEENENYVWVKYSKLGGPPGHHIWKQKDEGYRVISEGGLQGWAWISSLRRPHYEDPQMRTPTEDLPLDSVPRKKKERLENLVKGFMEKREEQRRVKGQRGFTFTGGGGLGAQIDPGNQESTVMSRISAPWNIRTPNLSLI